MPKKAVESTDLTVENLPKMTVIMLKNILESKNLSIVGKKADLVERLTAHLQQCKLLLNLADSIVGSEDAVKSPAKGDFMSKSSPKNPPSPTKSGIELV
jgi:hypothetical protein